LGCDRVHQEPRSLLDGDVAREFLMEVVGQAREKGLTSDEHFTVDGTLVEAWASLKSFQQKGEKRKEYAAG
jgi:transposase